MRWWLLLLVIGTGCDRLLGLTDVHGPDAAPDAPPPGMWASISVGARHACGLDLTGHIACLGDAISGGGTIVPVRVGDAMAPWKQVSAGDRHTCALSSDGHVACWGLNEYQQTDPSTRAMTVASPAQIAFPVGTTLAAVSAGTQSSCALDASGNAWCWGSARQTGGSTAGGPFELMPSPATTFASISAGWDHDCAIDRTGGVWCWGGDDQGQATGCTSSCSTAVAQPTMVALPMPAIAVAAGHQATCAVLGSNGQGEIWCWGLRSAFDLQAGVTAPEHVIDGSDWTGVVLGAAPSSQTAYAVCGLRAGNAYCWGNENLGGLGDGKWQGSSLPTTALPPIPADAVALSSSDEDAESGCAIANGNLSCWGDNRGGQLGVPATLHVAPVVIPSPTGTWTDVVAHAHHTCALDGSGHAWCWGQDADGEVSGTACAQEPCEKPMPVAAPASDAFDQLAVGLSFTCGHTSSAITCWGSNENGQLGTPAQGINFNAIALASSGISGGQTATCAFTANGQQCWGKIIDTPVFQPQPMTGIPELAAVHFGYRAACGIVAGTSATRGCWGYAYSGQLGNNEPNNAGETSPEAFQSFNDGHYTHTATSYRHTCVIDTATAGGQVMCWGNDENGEAGWPIPASSEEDSPVLIADSTSTPLSACTQVSTADFSSCAICGGAPYCWGANTHARLGIGTDANALYSATRVMLPNATYTEIAQDTDVGCALSSQGALVCWGFDVFGAIGDGSHGSAVPLALPTPPEG